MPDSSVLNVRPATQRDVKTISELHVNSFTSAYQGILPDDYLRSQTVDKKQSFWRDAVEYGEPQLLVALDGDKMVGFVGFDRSRDHKTPPTTGEIWAIYVVPSYWGQGAGLALWDAANEGLKEEGCTKVSIWLPLQNERALRFHELAGFKREMPSARTVPIGAVRIEEIRLSRLLA